MLRRYPHLQRWEQTGDVLQTAVMRLHRSLRKVKPDSVRSFLGLATVEIRRTLIDLLRHHFGPHGAAAHHHSDFLPSARDADQGVLPGVPDHDDAAESLEAWTSFHEAMDSLPEDEREVMHLGWYGGMQQAEMADVLGVSVSTIKRRWYRARLHLRHRHGRSVAARCGVLGTVRESVTGRVAFRERPCIRGAKADVDGSAGPLRHAGRTNSGRTAGQTRLPARTGAGSVSGGGVRRLSRVGRGVQGRIGAVPSD